MEMMRLPLLVTVLSLVGPIVFGQQLNIAYNVLVDVETDDYEVFIMDLDGGNKENITLTKAVDWTYVAGEEEILFISDRDTCYRCYFLYSMSADGSGLSQIGGIRLADSWMDHRNGGREIVITPHRTVDSAVYVIDRSGDIRHRVVTGLAASTDPVFVPGKDQIIFRGSPTAFKRDSGYADELYVVNLDGSGLRKLTTYPESDTTRPWFAYRAGPPRINAAEGFVSYQSFRDGKYRLFGLDLESGRNWLLLESEWDMGWHDWSPDGRWLAVEIFDTEQTQFHIGLVEWKSKQLSVLTDAKYKYQQAPVFVVRR